MDAPRLPWTAKGMAQMTEHHPAQCVTDFRDERSPAASPAVGDACGDFPTCASSSSESTAELLAGIVRLVEGQRQLAQELGLKDERVFPSVAAMFRESRPEAAMDRWMREPDGPKAIRDLFDDLCAHQLALVRAVDGVAVSALQTRRSGWPLRWLQRLRDRLPGGGSSRRLVEDDQARFQHVVAPAFALTYTRAREEDLERRIDTTPIHPT